MTTCNKSFIDGLLFAESAATLSSQGAARSLSSLSSLSLPAAAILECWMWRGEAGTADEKPRGGGGIGRNDKNSNCNYPELYNWNNGLYTDRYGLLLAVKVNTNHSVVSRNKPTWVMLLFDGIISKAERKVRDAVGLTIDLAGVSCFLSQFFETL